MGSEWLDQYERASGWTLGLLEGAAANLDARTPCDDWDVRTLMDHMLETQQYFVGAARGEDVAPPGQTPPQILGDDPATEFREARSETLQVFGQDGVLDKTGPALG